MVTQLKKIEELARQLHHEKSIVLKTKSFGSTELAM
jgi:hypothetical protein